MKHLLKRNLTLKALMMLMFVSISAGRAWAQSDESGNFAGNVTLSVTGGTSASACKVNIGEGSYDGVKAGTGKAAGAIKITVPQGTCYLHLHVAGWNGETVKLSVTPAGYSDIIAITSNSGIANNSPFTFSGDATTDYYYKVITFASALTGDTELTFTATSGRRFVIWGVTAEAGDPDDQSVATTITIDDSGLTNTNVFDGTAAGSLSATVSYLDVDGAPVAINNAVVTWSSENERVATVDANTGVVTLVAAGTTKITASYAGVEGQYKPSSKTYELKVTNYNPAGPGSSADNPASVNDAIAFINELGSGESKENYYVMGNVSRVKEFNTDGSITYWISEQGLPENELQVFKGKGLDGADFTSIDDIKVGAMVTVCGTVTLYKTTPEFDQGSKLISYSCNVAVPTFSPEGGTYNEAQTVSISCATEGATIMYSLDNMSWQNYTQPLNITETTTIYTYAYKGMDIGGMTSATYTIVDANSPGTENNPYTVAQARAAIDAGSGVTGVYAKGIVSKIVTKLNTQYGNISYNISDDGSEGSDQLQAYRGKSFRGAKFTSEDELKVGDEVVVYGNLKKYNSTYEFDADNYLVSLIRPEAPKHTVTWEDTEDYTLYVFDIADETDPLVSGTEVAEGTTIMVSPDVTKEGYELDELTVVTEDGGPVEVSVGTEAGTWTFVVPAGNVLLRATIKEQEVSEPTIAVEPATVNAKADGATGSVTVTYTNVSEDWDKVLQFVEVDETTGEYSSFTDEPDWMEAALDDGGNVVYTINANESTEARTAYACIFALGGENPCYSPVITFTQDGVKPLPEGKYFVKVTSNDELTDGYYLIVYENGNVAFDGGLETLDAASNTIEVQIDDNGIPAIDETKAAMFEITISTTESGKSATIFSASGKYIGRTADSNGLDVSETEEYGNIISIDAEGNALIKSATNTPYLKFNKTSGQTRFRYYKSGQESIQLFKLTNEIDERTRIELAFTDGVTELQMTLGDEPVAISANATLPGTDVSGEIEYTVDPKGTFVTYENGLVTAIAAGTATITATFPGNEYYKPATATLTVTVEEPVSTEPAIVLGKTEVALDATSASDLFSIEVENVSGALFQDYYMYPEPCDAEGNLHVGEELYEWANIYVQSNEAGTNVVVEASDNTSAEPRTAYFKIVLSVGQNEYYSELITITQEGVAAEPDFIFDFTQIDKESNENPWNLPVGSTYKVVAETEYTNSTYTTPVTITVAGSTGNGYYLHADGYLLYGKQGAFITLPAFDFAVSKIEVVGNGGASASVKQNIFVGDVAVSTETEGAKRTNTYEIAEAYQAAGNQYTLKVTSAHNSQVTYIYVYKADSTPATIPGDMNDDGVLSPEDVVALVEYITTMQPGDFNPAADVTGDGSVSIADVTALIGKLDPTTGE